MEDLDRVVWEDTEVNVDSDTVDKKVDALFKLLSRIDERSDLDIGARYYGFALCLLVMWAFIVSTSPHPRLALLVNTMENAMDDTFHFIILFVIFYFLFGLMGVAFFGQLFPDFQFNRVFTGTLWRILITLRAWGTSGKWGSN